MNYYSIYKVGEIISSEKFFAQRLQAASWVHWTGFVDNVMNGDYDLIMPLHIELCSTYKCNFNCPWCSCRKSRARNAKNKIELNLDEIKKIIKECKVHNIGIQWTGGEPLYNLATIQGINYGTELGVEQCLFTNGSLLNDDYINAILLSNLEFVRISLNCADPIYHSRFHGSISPNLSEKVLTNIKRLCELKLKAKSDVKIGISVVLDSNNIDDLPNTYSYIENIATDYPFALNYIVIRAVNDDFEGIETKKEPGFILKYNAFIQMLDAEKIGRLGVETVLPNEVRLDWDLPNCTQFGCSVFSEISPDGSVFLCSDKYGDKDFCIGNILHENIETVWRSSQKREIQNRHWNCFSSGKCPHHSRGWYFNFIFSQIEECRRNGEMQIVEKWIYELKKTVPYYNHSFFI